MKEILSITGGVSKNNGGSSEPSVFMIWYYKYGLNGSDSRTVFCYDDYQSLSYIIATMTRRIFPDFDLYSLFKTSRHADTEKIRRQFHNLQVACPEDQKRKLQEAWDILGDPESRRQYDIHIEGRNNHNARASVSGQAGALKDEDSNDSESYACSQCENESLSGGESGRSDYESNEPFRDHDHDDERYPYESDYDHESNDDYGEHCETPQDYYYEDEGVFNGPSGERKEETQPPQGSWFQGVCHKFVRDTRYLQELVNEIAGNFDDLRIESVELASDTSWNFSDAFSEVRNSFDRISVGLSDFETHMLALLDDDEASEGAWRAHIFKTFADLKATVTRMEYGYCSLHEIWLRRIWAKDSEVQGELTREFREQIASWESLVKSETLVSRLIGEFDLTI